MVRPLEYKANISLEEAKERLTEVREEFDYVRRRYSSLLEKFKRKISRGDQKTLADCIGVLLPLRIEKAVQEDPMNHQRVEDSLLYQVSQLNMEIMLYLSNFQNTGVKRVE